MPETVPIRTGGATREPDPDATEYHAMEIGAGRSVVILHDVYGGASNWSHVMEALSDDWRCLAVDLPGHGTTSPLTPDADLDSVVGDLCDVMDAFGTGPAVLVAHGASALLVLRIVQQRPEVTRGAILVSPGVIRTTAHDGGFDVVEDWFSQAYGEAFFTEQPGRAAEERTRVQGLDVRAVGRLHALLASPEATHLVRSAEPLGVPTLVIGSMRDRLVPPSEIDALGQRLEAEVEFMPAAGHMLPVEQPAQITSLVRDFLERM